MQKGTGFWTRDCPGGEPMCHMVESNKQSHLDSQTKKTWAEQEVIRPNALMQKEFWTRDCPGGEPLCHQMENNKQEHLDSQTKKTWAEQEVIRPNTLSQQDKVYWTRDCPGGEPLCHQMENNKQEHLDSQTKRTWAEQEVARPNALSQEPLCPDGGEDCDRRAPGHNQQAKTNTGNEVTYAQIANRLRTNLAVHEEPCTAALEKTPEEMRIQMDYFSRTFDMSHYDNAMKIYAELQKEGYNGAGPKVTSWELYDSAFTFDKVRRYDFVVENMNSLEQFEDNLNLNISSREAVQKFVQTAKSVKSSFNWKYHNGEFKDPANHDPLAEHTKTWADVKH